MKKILLVLLLLIAPFLSGVQAQDKDSDSNRIEVFIHRVNQNILKMGLSPGVDAALAAESMLAKAKQLNFKLVSHMPVSKVMAEMGIESRHLEILQFCTPNDAIQLVNHDPLFSAFLPCRISIVEDSEGKLWLYMVNLDIEIDNLILSTKLQEVAIRINQHMLAILTAGAMGSLANE